MKKTIALLIALVLVFSMVACGGEKTDPTTKPSTPTQTATPSTPAPTAALPTPSNQVAINMDGIIAGSVIASELSPAQKAELTAELKKDGIEVDFKADGSTVFTDDDGSVMTQKKDGTVTYKDQESGSEGQIGGEWPDNEYTKLVPKPDMKIGMANVDGEGFVATFSGASLDQIKAYAEKLKSAGFNKDLEVTDMYGMYAFSASNASGYTAELMYAADNANLMISK